MYIIRPTSIKSFNTQTNRNGEQFTIPAIVGVLGGFYTAITPDGKYVYIPNGDSGVEMVEIATRTATTFQAGPVPSVIAIAPNGHYAYISGFGDQNRCG